LSEDKIYLPFWLVTAKAINQMKTQISKDALEVQMLASFKSSWQRLGFSTQIPLGGDKMPRRAYAATVADVVQNFMQEQEAQPAEAVFIVLQTTLGNASQLGAKLVKEQWLKEDSPAQAADDLLARLLARKS